MSKSDMKIALSYPPGWIQLPVGTSKKLEGDRQLAAWADQTARKMLGDADPNAVRERARQLVQLTVSCRARNDRSGLAFYPASADGMVAMLDVTTYTPDREDRVITMELLEEIYATPTADTLGDVLKSRVTLPSGPAVRVRASRVEEPDPTGHGVVMEGVTHAIRPPGFDGAVVATMTWTALQLGDKLAEMADAIARTIRVTLAR
ncbi:MAG TPA: hypothetical protein VIZ43_22280 [Trebonia sp.]